MKTLQKKLLKSNGNGSQGLDIAQVERITIAPPNFQVAEFRIVGTAPYVQNKFSKKAQDQIRATQEAGSTARSGKKREAKDFQACYESAKHKTKEGWCGIPAPAFRNAMVDACKTAGFHMTKARLAVFVLPDGFDAEDGTPLVKITKGAPKYHQSWVRNETGVVDLRARAMWDEGWEARVRVRFDADMFTKTDVAALLMRAGQQVGVGEGRPGGKTCGMGWGLFDLAKPEKNKD